MTDALNDSTEHEKKQHPRVALNKHIRWMRSVRATRRVCASFTFRVHPWIVHFVCLYNPRLRSIWSVKRTGKPLIRGSKPMIPPVF